MSILEEPQRGLMMWEATTLQRHVFQHKLQLGDKHMAILLTANSIIPRFYAANSFQKNSHLVYAAASFLLAQKMHLCSNSIPRVAAHFLDACVYQLQSKHSVLLAQPLQKLSQLRSEYIAAKTHNSANQAELRSRWDTMHAEFSQFLANGMRLAERKLVLTIGFRNLHLIGTEWTIFRKVEDTLELHSRPGWASSATPRRDIDLNHCAAAGLSPRQVAVQFMSQSACSSQAVEKYGPCAVAMAAIKNAVDTKTFPLLDIPEGSTLVSAVLEKVDLHGKVSETEVRECWKYALKANQIQKQQVQLLQGPTLAPCPPPHSPPGPTKISPNLSTVSSSTPLSTTPTKRCRWNDSESAEPTRFKGARTDSPRTAQATPVDGRRAHPKGIDRVSRPEHEEDRHKAVRPSPQGRSSGPVAKDALPGPPSPESLEEGELRSP